MRLVTAYASCLGDVMRHVDSGLSSGAVLTSLPRPMLARLDSRLRTSSVANLEANPMRMSQPVRRSPTTLVGRPLVGSVRRHRRVDGDRCGS
jgi:hypothetical protein